MEGEQPLCNLSQHGTVSKRRERQNQTPPVWKMCTEMTDPDVKIWSSLHGFFGTFVEDLGLAGGHLEHRSKASWTHGNAGLKLSSLKTSPHSEDKLRLTGHIWLDLLDKSAGGSTPPRPGEFKDLETGLEDRRRSPLHHSLMKFLPSLGHVNNTKKCY